MDGERASEHVEDAAKNYTEYCCQSYVYDSVQHNHPEKHTDITGIYIRQCVSAEEACDDKEGRGNANCNETACKQECIYCGVPICFPLRHRIQRAEERSGSCYCVHACKNNAQLHELCKAHCVGMQLKPQLHAAVAAP